MALSLENEAVAARAFASSVVALPAAVEEYPYTVDLLMEAARDDERGKRIAAEALLASITEGARHLQDLLHQAQARARP